MESELLAPITKMERIAFFVKLVWRDADWERVRWRGVHPFARTRQFRVLSAFWVLALLAAFPWLGPLFQKVLAPLFLVCGVALIWLISHLTYKQTAYAFDNKFIYIKNGFLSLHFWVIPIDKIQNIGLVQTPFQRRRGLGSMRIDVAGSAVGREAVIPHINLQLSWLLFNRLIKPRIASAGTGSVNGNGEYSARQINSQIENQP